MSRIPSAIFEKGLDDGRLVAVVPMIYNTRITIGPDEQIYDHGWCYDSPAVAIAAAVAWDGEGCPVGYKKQAC